MGRRTILLVAAVVVAAVGAVLVFAYVNGVNDRALADQSPEKVLVAKTFVAAGTTAGDAAKAGAFELKTVAKSSVAPGALSDVTPIVDKVALAPIFPGQQILAAEFGTQGAASSLPIPGADIGISLQLNDPARVAGFVQPGSNVAIFASVRSQAAASSASGDLVTQLLLPKVQVIAVGPTTTTSQISTNQRTGQTNTEQISRAILTLAVSQLEAQKLILAQQQGSLYFGLLTANSHVGAGPATNAGNLFR